MQILVILIAVLSLALGGCASSPTAGQRSSAESASPPRVSLAAEQRRLAELFRGTPVVFEMQADGSLRITVPLTFSFDKGRYAVKPPLAAVLDRVARIQRSEATRFSVAATADPQSKGHLLANERASSTRDYLVARGIPATRLAIIPSGVADGVLIVVGDLSAQ